MKRIVVTGLIVVMLIGFPMAVSGDGGVATDTHEAGIPSANGFGSATVGVLALEDTDEERNETTRHRNPDEYSGDGDDGAVESWLSGWMTDQLGESTIQISEGEYELARDVLGDEYDDRVEQFVEVTGDDDAGDTFRETRDKQAELTDLREEFEETMAAYEQALEDGDEERARELARTLVELADAIEDVTVDLEELLAEIEGITEDDLSTVRESVGELRDESVSDATSVAEAEFVETALVVELTDRHVSFLEPAALTGQLQTAEGEPLANESIQLTVHEDPVSVETGADGEFSVEYRPTDLPLSLEALSVRYVPAGDSVYLGSEDSVDVAVEQVEPTLDVAAEPDSAKFGEAVSVNGALAVEDVLVDEVPVVVTLGEDTLETITVTDGSFEAEVDVPASVPDGDQELTVELPFEDQALAGVAASQTLSVEESDTSLSIDAESINDSAVAVTGTLSTADGTGVGGESVDIRLGGVSVDSVSTESDGTFEVSVAVPSSVDTDEVVVVAAFDGVGTNLAPAQDEAQVTLSGGSGVPGGSESQLSTTSLLGVVLGGVLLLFVLGGGLWYRRRGADAPVVDRGRDTDDTVTTTEPNTRTVDSLFEHATDHLQAGRPELAVRAGYSAVRQQFESAVDSGRSLTHWEFYRAYRDTEPEGGDSLDEFRTVTEAYEQAAYSERGVPVDEAEQTVTSAKRLCTRSDGGELPEQEP